MRNRISDKDRLLHILEAIKDIQQFTSEINYLEYNKDYKLRLAIVKLFEIIGEAANGITSETRKKFSEIEWSVLRVIRNILVHEYFGIDYEMIWDSIQKNIPVLKTNIENILREWEK